MSNKEQLEQLQARQVELQTIMARSDAHAAKCIKLGKRFSTEYPEEKPLTRLPMLSTTPMRL